MAFGASVTNTTTLLADTFTQVLNKRAADTAMSASPFIRSLLRDLGEGEDPFTTRVNQSKTVNGGSVELRFRGALMTVTGVGTQTASTSNNYAQDFISTTAPVTHYNVMCQLGVNELKYINGPQAKTDYYMDKVKHVEDSMFDKICTDFHATNDQTASAVGSWRLALQTDDTTSTYLGIARADSGNSGLRGNVDAAGTALTLARIEAQVNNCAANNGNIDLGILGTANFGVLQGLVEGNYRVILNDDELWSRYGGRYVNIAGAKFALDGKCSSTNVGLMDTTSWYLCLDNQGYSISDAIRDVSKTSIVTLPVDFYIAIVCDAPRKNARLTTN